MHVSSRVYFSLYTYKKAVSTVPLVFYDRFFRAHFFYILYDTLSTFTIKFECSYIYNCSFRT